MSIDVTVEHVRTLSAAVKSLVQRACEDFSRETSATITVSCTPIRAQTFSDDNAKRIGYAARVEVTIE